MEAANREKRRKLKATKITDNVNADRVKQLRALSVKVPGSGTGPELEGAKEVREAKMRPGNRVPVDPYLGRCVRSFPYVGWIGLADGYDCLKPQP